MTTGTEYTAKGGRPWQQALTASETLDRVTAEFIDRLGKLGADENDMNLYAQVLTARSSLAVADALHALRQEMSLLTGQMRDLNARVEGLKNKFPALG